jgi:hypothetical protein
VVADDITRAVIVDVDGVVSPVHGHTVWGDDQKAGNVFGPAFVSPAMCARLDLLASRVPCWWLTSWDQEMRDAMYPFPGRDWPTLAVQPQSVGRSWWKWEAVKAWLSQHPRLQSVVWCDDHLGSGTRRARVRSQLQQRGLHVLLIAPQTSVGLTPDHLAQIEEHLLPP